MRVRPRRRRAAGLVSAAIWITATACASPAVSPVVSAVPSPSAPSAEDCRPIELLAPSGERVDLTGTWRVIGGRQLYNVLQEGDCVWIVGGFEAAAEGGRFGNLGRETYVFDGHLRTDFTVHGRWASLVYTPGPEDTGPYTGTETYRLGLDGDPWTLRTESHQPLEKVSDRYIAP